MHSFCLNGGGKQQLWQLTSSSIGRLQKEKQTKERVSIQSTKCSKQLFNATKWTRQRKEKRINQLVPHSEIQKSSVISLSKPNTKPAKKCANSIKNIKKLLIHLKMELASGNGKFFYACVTIWMLDLSKYL